MTLSRRDLSSQVTLVFYELSLVPLSILATFFVLAFVGGLLGLTEVAGQWLGIGPTILEGLTVFIVALTCIAMASAGGTVVYGYQHFFDRSFSRLRPLLVLAVPLLTATAAAAYALGHLRTVSPPLWVQLIVVLSVHSLAFRAIAVYSMLDRSRRSATRVGTVAAIPMTAALITLVTRHFLDAGWNGVGQVVVGVAATPNGSADFLALVVIPVLIAGTYGFHCSRDGGISLQLLGSPRPTISADAVLGRLGRLRSGSGLKSKNESGRGTDGTRRRRGVRPSGAPPPSSPDEGGRKRRVSAGSGSDGSGSSRSVFRGGGAGTEEEAGDDTGSRGTHQSTADSESNAVPDEPASESDDGESGTGSDTRIFTDDFGQYGAGVDTCPDCDTEIPSDGQYKFCPQCGTEL